MGQFFFLLPCQNKLLFIFLYSYHIKNRTRNYINSTPSCNLVFEILMFSFLQILKAQCSHNNVVTLNSKRNLFSHIVTCVTCVRKCLNFPYLISQFFFESRLKCSNILVFSGSRISDGVYRNFHKSLKIDPCLYCLLVYFVCNWRFRFQRRKIR